MGERRITDFTKAGIAHYKIQIINFWTEVNGIAALKWLHYTTSLYLVGVLKFANDAALRHTTIN